MRCGVILILFLIFSNAGAQDKLFLTNGKRINCCIVSVEPNSVIYKDSISSSNLRSILKQELLLAEYSDGKIVVIPHKPETKVKDLRISRMSEEQKSVEKKFSNQIIGIQIPDLLFGRLTFSYEHLFLGKQMGLVIPFSLSYDPRILFAGSRDSLITLNNPIRRNAGFITGLDLNYYFDTKGYSKFFVGPRLRYGTDVYLLNITGYSVQFQNGFLITGSRGKSASTIAFGFGYVRVLSSPMGRGINPKQSFPWGSVTIRIGFRA